MNVYLLWYNPVNKEYQIGRRDILRRLLDNSNEPESFVLLEKFTDLTEKAKEKLKLQIRALNNTKSYTQSVHRS